MEDGEVGGKGNGVVGRGREGKWGRVGREMGDGEVGGKGSEVVGRGREGK